MPNKTIQRLESYQSGGSICDTDDDGNDDRNRVGSGGVAPLVHQFSLIGQVDDNGDENVARFWNCGYDRIQRWCAWWCMTYQRRLAIMASLCIIIIFISPILGSTISGTASTVDDNLSCPIHSSYSVSTDVMKLKESSTVENMQNGAVATDHSICSQIGVSILKDGGNAADAAVASAFCLGVVNPTSSGIGGGAFILVHSFARNSSNEDDETAPPFEDARTHDSRRTKAMSADKVTEFIDCRETAPDQSTYDMYESDPKLSTLGGLAVAIPGELRGLELLHYRHGSISWEHVVRPAMELARDGFRVNTHLAKVIQQKKDYIRKMPNLGHMLTKKNDGVTLLKEGDTSIRSQYAKTLEEIMYGGADAFYEGDMANMLAHDIKEAGGIITTEDISNYRPILRNPLISRVAGYNVVGAPPPSSGGAAIIGALRFLSGFAQPYSALLDTLSKHWFVEACRHVFAIRMSLSDPKFDPEENSNAVKDLIKGQYIELLLNMTLDDSVLNLSQYGGAQWNKLKDADVTNVSLVDAQEGDRRRRRDRLFNYLNDHGTSSLSVVDKNLNSVTITSSINLELGSKVVCPSTGVLLNNQMDDFSTPGRANFFGLHPSESNYIVPGKRPLSSMAPTMVFKQERQMDEETDIDNNLGKLVLSLGGSGGPKIITAVLSTILNYLFVGMPLFEAISEPRIHNQLIYHGAVATNIEEETLPQGPSISLSERTRRALQKRGHDLIPTDYLGTVQAVSVDLETNSLSAVADIRKQGIPAGY